MCIRHRSKVGIDRRQVTSWLCSYARIRSDLHPKLRDHTRNSQEMPGKGLLSSLADKAQAAIATSPLASKFPAGTGQHDATAAGVHSPASSDAQHQAGYAAPVQEQSGTLGGRHHGLETIQHHLRTLQVQYSLVASLTLNRDLSHVNLTDRECRQKIGSYSS